jgi:hypothetical protein
VRPAVSSAWVTSSGSGAQGRRRITKRGCQELVQGVALLDIEHLKQVKLKRVGRVRQGTVPENGVCGVQVGIGQQRSKVLEHTAGQLGTESLTLCRSCPRGCIGPVPTEVGGSALADLGDTIKAVTDPS